MARMFPERLASKTESEAERRLYRLLQAQLSDSYVVFHSAPWLVKSKGQEPRDGEADFVIAHADRGVLVIEVKGGRVGRDGATDAWWSVDGAGRRHSIQDPFEQAKREAFALRAVAEGLGDWPSKEVRIVRAVAFPDCRYDGRLVPSGPSDIVIDERHLDDLAARIDEIFDWWSFSGDAEADGSALTSKGMGALELLLARSFTMPSPLRRLIDADEESIVQLTEHQFELLDFLRHQRHALITGVAGAGKTMLAAEHARRLSSHMDVLLLCVDRALARHLRATIGALDRIDVLTYHELSRSILTRVGIEVTRENENPAWWRTEGPELVRLAVAELSTRYDALIVDEAQDVDSTWWPPLMDLLTDSSNDIVYVFGDDKQDLYHGGIDSERGIVMPMSLPRFELHQNRRTTRYIHDFAQRFFVPAPDGPRPDAIGPVGRPVVVETYPTIEAESDEVAQRVAERGCRVRLQKVLDQIAHRGEVSNEDVMILTPRRYRSWFGAGVSAWVGNFRVVPGLTVSGDVVTELEYRSDFRIVRLQDFKGLEAKVVILVEIDGRVAPEDLDALLYIGSSRARSHLIVIADDQRAAYIDQRSSRLPDAQPELSGHR